MQTHQDLLVSEKQAALKAQAEAALAKALYQIYKNNLQITPCEANDRAIISYFNGDEITLEEFTRSYENDPSFRNRLAHRTLEQADRQAAKEKAAVIDEILSLMIVSPESAPSVRKDLEAKSIEHLQTRLAEIKAKQSMTKGQAREILQQDAENRRAAAQRKPFLPLEYDAAAIKRLSLKELKDLQKKFGADSITARLNGWDLLEQEQYLKSGFGGI